MSSEILNEEFEVLQSIYPTELFRISNREVDIAVEPDEYPNPDQYLKLLLHITYPDEYPEALPMVSITSVEGELTIEEEEALLTALRKIGEENLGMVSTFTMVSHLRELLADLLKERARKIQELEREKERLALEAEEARSKGTPVTLETFKSWRIRFRKEMDAIKGKLDDEALKGLSPREREDVKKVTTRLTGRQLFEKNRSLDNSDSSLLEDGVTSVDFSQYERGDGPIQEEEEAALQFSDSD